MRHGPHRPQRVRLVELEGRHLEAGWAVPLHTAVYPRPDHSPSRSTLDPKASEESFGGAMHRRCGQLVVEGCRDRRSSRRPCTNRWASHRPVGLGRSPADRMWCLWLGSASALGRPCRNARLAHTVLYGGGIALGSPWIASSDGRGGWHGGPGGGARLVHEPKNAVGCTAGGLLSLRWPARQYVRTDPITQTKETTWGQQSMR